MKKTKTKDKKSVYYFMVEMTKKELYEFYNKMGVYPHNLNMIDFKRDKTYTKAADKILEQIRACNRK